MASSHDATSPCDLLQGLVPSCVPTFTVPRLVKNTQNSVTNTYGLLTKWGQDGWILAKFFFCVFMDRDEVEVHKLAKKERGQYPAILTEQTWSIKDLLYGFWWKFACGMQRVVPSGQDGSILPARVANHSARFGSSCPLAELAIK